MAVALVIRVGDLLLELLTHTFGRLCALPAAGTVPAGALEALANGLNDLLDRD